MEELCPDPVTVGMCMVNSGPSVDENVEDGKVYLYEGWLIDDSPH